jgi:hypothetical protein
MPIAQHKNFAAPLASSLLFRKPNRKIENSHARRSEHGRRKLLKKSFAP